MVEGVVEGVELLAVNVVALGCTRGGRGCAHRRAELGSTNRVSGVRHLCWWGFW